MKIKRQIRINFAGEGLDSARTELVAKFPEILMGDVSAPPAQRGCTGGTAVRLLLIILE